MLISITEIVVAFAYFWEIQNQVGLVHLISDASAFKRFLFVAVRLGEAYYRRQSSEAGCGCHVQYWIITQRASPTSINKFKLDTEGLRTLKNDLVEYRRRKYIQPHGHKVNHFLVFMLLSVVL